MDLGMKRRVAVKAARDKWDMAPAHVKIMAGAYVEPIFAAIEAMAAELDTLCIDMQAIAQALPVDDSPAGLTD